MHDSDFVSYMLAALLVAALLAIPFTIGQACQARTYNSACSAYCYPAGVNEKAVAATNICVCQEVVLP